jgi:hypothetical protein
LHSAQIALQLSVYIATMAVTTMPAPRETWTDERLDDLATKTDNGFADVRIEIRALRTDTQGMGTELRAEIQGMRAETNARFDCMQRLILQVGAAMFGTMLIGFLSVIATFLATHS